MMHPNFLFARRATLPCGLALLACAAIGCGRSADLFPDERQGNDGCGGALVCAPEVEPSPEPGAERPPTTEPDTDTEPAPGELYPTLNDPETAQPSDALPLEPEEPDPEVMPAGPQMSEPGERPPEAPREPPRQPPDAGVGIAVDAGIEDPPDGPRPGRPPRPPRP